MKASNKHVLNQHSGSETVAEIDKVFADDLKNAVLVVSLLINLFLLIGYMIMQVTSAYDHQVISLLFIR